MRYYYFIWQDGSDPDVMGALCVQHSGEFPLGYVHEIMHHDCGHFCLILNWKEISEQQFKEFQEFCKQMGYGHMGKPINRRDILKPVK